MITETITTWVLVVGATIAIQASDPFWVRQIGPEMWMKIVIGWFPDEELCMRAARDFVANAIDDEGPITFESSHCEIDTRPFVQDL